MVGRTVGEIESVNCRFRGSSRRLVRVRHGSWRGGAAGEVGERERRG